MSELNSRYPDTPILRHNSATEAGREAVGTTSRLTEGVRIYQGSTMEKVIRRQCFNHPERVAVARCPVCTHLYCRECIAEHQDRVLCAHCLKASVAESSQGRSASPLRSLLGHAAQLLFGLVLTWLLFYGVGRLLIRIPTVFHDGTIWGDL